jgi:hypothetical protein
MRTASRRRWTSLLQPVALVLLALIAADVATDADCDPLRMATPPAEAEVASAAGDTTADPCADVCLPDCFCCARSVVALSVIVAPAPVLLSPLAVAGRDDRPDGIRPSVERPPRT